MNNSPRYTLNTQDRQTIIAIIIHGLVGIVLTLISEVFLKMNYGLYTPYVSTALSLISLVATQYLNGPSASTLKIQQLEAQIQALQPSVPTQNTIPQNNTASDLPLGA